jgi:hypothetical protein
MSTQKTVSTSRLRFRLISFPALFFSRELNLQFNLTLPAGVLFSTNWGSPGRCRHSRTLKRVGWQSSGVRRGNVMATGTLLQRNQPGRLEKSKSLNT